DEYAASGDGVQSRQHVADSVFFDQVPLRTRVHGSVERAFVGLHRQHDDDGWMRQRAGGANDLQAGDLRQVEVHDRDVRLDRLDLLYGAFAVADFRGNYVLRV